MRVLLPRRNFSIWLFGSAAAIGGIISACAHVLNNYRMGSDELSKSIGILILIAIIGAECIFIGYPRSYKSRLFINLNDALKKSFTIQSKSFELALRNLCLIHNRVVILEMNWDFLDKKTGMDFIKGSSLKNEKIRCFVDVIQGREVVKTFQVDITNTRTFKSLTQEENEEYRWANIIEIDANEISGEVDILFRDLVYLSGKYELIGIIFNPSCHPCTVSNSLLNVLSDVSGDTPREHHAGYQ